MITSLNPPAIALRGVTKIFGSGETKTWALRGVDLDVNYGELTLLVGPIEEGLADAHAPLPPAHRERQEIAHRNALRLLRLVNTLLDFSRIEAGRSDDLTSTPEP